MKAVLVDGETSFIHELTDYMNEFDIKISGIFTDPFEAHSFIMEDRPDVIFMETVLSNVNGINLACSLQETLPDIEIIFITSHPEHALEAYAAYPFDFLSKPLDGKRFAKTMKRLGKKLSEKQALKKSYFYIRCFGKLKFYKGNETVSFPTQKTGELLAYILSHSDSPIYRDELMCALFGEETDERNLNNMRVTLFRLRKTFEDAGLSKEKLFINSNCSIQIKTGLCDLVDFNRFVSKNRNINDGNIDEAAAILERLNGELFSDIDAIWASEKREWLDVQSEELAIKVSLYYLSKGKIAKAEESLLKLIGMNALSEQAFQLLLDLYINSGEYQKYGFYFRRYEKLMQEELHSLVDHKYQDYFKLMCQ